jgi:hypothetical protein
MKASISAANRSADAMARSAAAATEANKATWRALHLEYRPLLVFDSMRFDTAGEYRYFSPSWKNRGRSPALVTKILFTRGYADWLNLDHYIAELKGEKPIHVTDEAQIVWPNGEIDVDRLLVREEAFSPSAGFRTFKIPAPIRELDQIGIDGNWDMLISWARIEYQDVLNPTKTYFTDMTFGGYPIRDNDRIIGFDVKPINSYTSME